MAGLSVNHERCIRYQNSLLQSFQETTAYRQAPSCLGLYISFVRSTICLTPEPHACLLPLLCKSALSLLSCKQRWFLSPASASSLAGEQGGNYRLAHTRALCHTAVCLRLGQSPNDARRSLSVPLRSTARARLPPPSTLLFSPHLYY